MGRGVLEHIYVLQDTNRQSSEEELKAILLMNATNITGHTPSS
jgi:hypothetical protein